MAGTINKVILIGRLGADPDVRYMQDGTPIVNFNMATDEPVRSADGTWETRAEWHRIVAYRKLAETCANLLGKGRLVYVEGRLRLRTWEGQDGQKRARNEVIADRVKFLDRQGAPVPVEGKPEEVDQPGEVEPDDIPF